MKDEATDAATTDSVSLRELGKKLPDYIERNEGGDVSMIFRPTGAALIQIDDCTTVERDLLADYSFLIAETSPASFQAWLALPRATTEDERTEVRERLLRGALLGSSANAGAGGAMRWVGSRNCKPVRRRADGSFPRVKLTKAENDRVVTVAELERDGLLAERLPPCDSFPSAISEFSVDTNVHRAEPSYEKCLQSVRAKANGEADRSAADLLFAVTCFDWKYGFDEVVALLNRVSEKARARKDGYAERTVRYAQSKQVHC